MGGCGRRGRKKRDVSSTRGAPGRSKDALVRLVGSQNGAPCPEIVGECGEEFTPRPARHSQTGRPRATSSLRDTHSRKGHALVSPLSSPLFFCSFVAHTPECAINSCIGTRTTTSREPASTQCRPARCTARKAALMAMSWLFGRRAESSSALRFCAPRRNSLAFTSSPRISPVTSPPSGPRLLAPEDLTACQTPMCRSSFGPP